VRAGVVAALDWGVGFGAGREALFLGRWRIAELKSPLLYWLIFFRSFADRVGVGKIPKPARGKFVLYQVLGGDHVNRNAIDEGFDPFWPCLLEGYSINLLQDVNAKWRLTNLKDGFGIVAEVMGCDPGQGRSVSGQSAIDDLAVGLLWTYKDVQVRRRPRFSVNSNRITADKKIFNPVFVERE
jgi:hypothetical protein